jgi:glycosyltransferase involved in cell wall biosynthesis
MRLTVTREPDPSIESEPLQNGPRTGNVPRVLLIGPSLRIMGGQAVMADRMLGAMRQDGVMADFLPINPQPPPLLRFTERIKYLRTIVVSTFYLGKLLKHVPQYDVVHLFSASHLSFIISQTPAILVARHFGKPLILNYRSGEAERHLRHWRHLVGAILKLTQHIVVPSGYLVHVFHQFGFRATAIPNVVDPTAVRYRHRTAVEPRIIVPRTLEPLYNVECAIRAFHIVQRKYPHARMTILGDGAQRPALERLVQRLQLQHVRFAGRVERDQIGEYYDNHDLLLNTSSIDNMPVSILEGFAAGLPFVTTDAGGIPFIVQYRINGHLVKVDDHRAAADRVIELAENPAEVARLSRLGQQETEKYTWENVAEQWYQLYRDTWNAHRAPGGNARNAGVCR